MRRTKAAVMKKRPRRSTADPLSEERGVQRILRAARRLFVHAGGAGFSARGVAKGAGVSLGAVPHLLPSKDALLGATLEHVLAVFHLAHERLPEELPLN